MTQFFSSLLSPHIATYALFGNSIAQYSAALAWFVIGWGCLKLIERVLLKYLQALTQRTKTDLDDTLVAIVASLKPPFYFFLSLYIALRTLTLPASYDRILTLFLIMVLTYQGVRALGTLIEYLALRWERQQGVEQSRAAVDLMKKIAKGVLWVMGALFILSNFGINITSLIAGLGIGGVAVALALQNILADLFSSFAIYFDKPFVIGDFIIVGEHMGTVEKIGIKTSRIRSLQGEEIVISNQELTSARIQNFKKMQERRKVFSVGVEYDTPSEKLEKIPAMLREAFTDMPQARFERAHFHKFGDSALIFEVVYFVLSADYNVYMDTHQELHLRILKEFRQERIQFAFPSQTLYLHHADAA